MHYQPFDLSRRQYLGGDAGNSHGTDGDDDDDGCDDDDDRHEDQQDHDDHDRRDDGHQADDGDGDCNFAVEIPKVTSFGRLTIQGFSLVSDAGLWSQGPCRESKYGTAVEVSMPMLSVRRRISFQETV